MTPFRQAGRWLVLLALVLAFAGCAKPPEAEQQAAKKARNVAATAGAERYAATEFTAARALWDQAEARMKDRDFKEARQLYVDASKAFEKATEAVAAGRKAVADEGAVAIAALEESWKGLDAAARKVEKRMQEKKAAWEAESRAFLEGLAAGKAMVDRDPIGAMTRLDGLKTFIEKWDAILQELAAPPAKPAGKR